MRRDCRIAILLRHGVLVGVWCAGFFGSMADSKEAEAEITLETYDKHHVKVPKSIATRSAIINMMIEGDLTKLRTAADGRLVNQLMRNTHTPCTSIPSRRRALPRSRGGDQEVGRGRRGGL